MKKAAGAKPQPPPSCYGRGKPPPYPPPLMNIVISLPEILDPPLWEVVGTHTFNMYTPHKLKAIHVSHQWVWRSIVPQKHYCLMQATFHTGLCVPNAAYVIAHADHYLSVCPDRLPRRYVGAEMVYASRYELILRRSSSARDEQ